MSVSVSQSVALWSCSFGAEQQSLNAFTALLFVKETMPTAQGVLHTHAFSLIIVQTKVLLQAMSVLAKELHDTRATCAEAQQAARLKTTELEATSQASKSLQEQLSGLALQRAAAGKCKEVTKGEQERAALQSSHHATLKASIHCAWTLLDPHMLSSPPPFPPLLLPHLNFWLLWHPVNMCSGGSLWHQ